MIKEAKTGRPGPDDFHKKQADKYTALLKEGQVDVVEYHFFRNTRGGKYGPTPALRKYLEDRGIKVFIWPYD